ncbi:MAG TPA: 30S ribosomal protein S20 [Acidobacteriota bacterium]|nr:30S ribosomal protein S20 [Acidobacteriota bacterium]
MANIRSAVKRMRQNRVRRLRNRSARSAMRTQIKKFRSLVAEKKVDEAREFLPRVYSVIDKTARKGAIHANTAARYKSRLARTLTQEAS